MKIHRILLLFLYLVGCSSNPSGPTTARPEVSSFVVYVTSVASESDPVAATLMPIENLGRDIELRIIVNDPDRSLKVGWPISLKLENLSREKIVFPIGYGIRIFTNSGSGWVEVKDKVLYRAEDIQEIVVNPKGSPASGTSITAFPDLQNEGQPVDVLVFIVGQKKGPDGDEEVGAYAKVTLQP